MAVADSQKMGLLAKDAELGSSINEKAIVRKLNKHLLVKFLLMTLLCYIGESKLCPMKDDTINSLSAFANCTHVFKRQFLDAIGPSTPAGLGRAENILQPS